MKINQVKVSNTFNEFRTTFNDAANTINNHEDRIVLGTANVLPNAFYSGTVRASNLTAGRITFATSSGQLTDNAALTVNESTLDVYATSNVHVNNKAHIIASNGDFVSVGNVSVTQVNAVSHVGAGGELSVWVAAKNDDQNTHKVFGIANTNNASDMLIVNQNDGANAYGEFIAIHHSGNTDQGWISMGINSTNYAEGAYGVTKAEDGYILYQAPAGTSKNGDLVIGTGANGTKNRIIFSAEGFDDPANNTQMIINPGQNIHIEVATQSSNTTTGALTVNGGIGLNGNLNIGGNVAIAGTITLGGGANTVSTSTLQVDNPMIFFGANNVADTLDLGIVGEYTSSGTKYTGLLRDASDSGIYKLFSGLSTRPANTANFTGASYSTLQVGSLRAVDTTASSSKTTGSLIVSGGAGIAGEVYATSFTANTGATINEFSTDNLLSGASNTAIPTEGAVKFYVDTYAGGEVWSVANTTTTVTQPSSRTAFFADTSNGSFTINLPASPLVGDAVRIVDVAGTFGGKNLIVGRANTSHRIMGLASDFILNINNSSTKLVWAGATYGWRFV